jgi:rare lipoprotein A
MLACAACSTYAPAFSRPAYQPPTVSKPLYTAPASAHLTLASWYGPGFIGHRTSNGEIFNQDELTAASRSLPLGSYARVTNLNNGKSVIVRVNDRGPYVRGRGIDLSPAAASRVGLMREGIARVRVARLDTTASAIADPPEQWSGRVRVRRHYRQWRYHRYHHRNYSGRIIRDPIGTWLLELVESR